MEMLDFWSLMGLFFQELALRRSCVLEDIVRQTGVVSLRVVSAPGVGDHIAIAERGEDRIVADVADPVVVGAFDDTNPHGLAIELVVVARELNDLEKGALLVRGLPVGLSELLCFHDSDITGTA